MGISNFNQPEYRVSNPLEYIINSLIKEGGKEGGPRGRKGKFKVLFCAKSS